LTRIIKLDGVGKRRNKMTRELVLAIRELMRQGDISDQTRDLAAFISLRLDSIFHTIDQSVAAWEKRGYWVKADRFRLEWSWSESLGNQMREALLKEDWQTVAQTAANIAQKLESVKVPQRHRLGEPWHGAWEEFSK
jgi:hypothetical protein